jgi:hypothetical protein
LLIDFTGTISAPAAWIEVTTFMKLSKLTDVITKDLGIENHIEQQVYLKRDPAISLA